MLTFFTETKQGQMAILATSLVVILSTVIGIILSTPIFWMEWKVFEQTWMNLIAPYFFAPLIVFAVLVCFVFAPYLSFVANSEKMAERENNGQRRLMKCMSLLLGMIPGGMIYSLPTHLLYIPNGPHNIFGVMLCSMLYLLIVRSALRKPFAITQEFIPLS